MIIIISNHTREICYIFVAKTYPEVYNVLYSALGFASSRQYEILIYCIVWATTNSASMCLIVGVAATAHT